MDDKNVSKTGVKGHIGIRTGHTTSIIASERMVTGTIKYV